MKIHAELTAKEIFTEKYTKNMKKKVSKKSNKRYTGEIYIEEETKNYKQKKYIKRGLESIRQEKGEMEADEKLGVGD